MDGPRGKNLHFAPCGFTLRKASNELKKKSSDTLPLTDGRAARSSTGFEEHGKCRTFSLSALNTDGCVIFL